MTSKNSHGSNRVAREPLYDGWLDKYFAALPDKGLTVIELGCGPGDDTSFLVKTGHSVISCDYSEEALEGIRTLYPSARTAHFDLREPFPFADGVADVVVASLCLHFFGETDMERALAEIRRILRPGGVLLCRLNSARERRTNRKDETELSPGLYMTRSGLKRFFDENAVLRSFAGWSIEHMEEITTEKFAKRKSLWEIRLTLTDSPAPRGKIIGSASGFPY